MRHGVIPDTQCKPGQDFKFLRRVGQYLADQQPERIICLGDFADMESLSSYDRGKKSFEGRRYKKDIEAAHRAMDILMEPIARARGYKPILDLTYGNHEHRIARVTEDQPELDGLITLEALRYRDWGWATHEFLQPIKRDGVMYCHYFVSGVMGRPITTAAALLTKKHMSCVAGHQQGRQIAMAYRADGKSITGIITGSCYEGKEAYLGPQGNKHWRGMLILNEVSDGQFDEMPISLSYLARKFG